jgi:hypothetical protein
MPTKPEEKQTKPPTLTPQSELSEVERLQLRVEQLEAEKAELLTQVQALSSAGGGFAAYIIRTPSKTYTGVTAGLQFRDGVAVLPVSKNAEEITWKMRHDFGYQVDLVDDWRETPEAAGLHMAMVDVMAGG